MDKSHGRPDLRTSRTQAGSSTVTLVKTDDWRRGVPTLTGSRVVLREFRKQDAPSLLAMLTGEEVTRFISPPPGTVEGFERFIASTATQRTLGSHACFAVTLQGFDAAIGVFQIRETEPDFTAAEWGFAIGSAFWGTGVFQESAALVLEFVFETLGVHRLEARVMVRNGRGHRALQKIGAVQEGVLRRSFLRNGQYFDQVLCSIVEDDWRASRRPVGRIVAPSQVH
jgi:RimJ/RimL family protein N-acetyltransferase